MASLLTKAINALKAGTLEPLGVQNSFNSLNFSIAKKLNKYHQIIKVRILAVEVEIT